MREWNVTPQRSGKKPPVPETPRRPKALPAAQQPAQKTPPADITPKAAQQTPSPAARAPQPETQKAVPVQPATPPARKGPVTAEQQLAGLIEAYKTGRITRAEYARDKQLLLAKISPDSVKLRRTVKAPVQREVEQTFGFTRRFSLAQGTIIACLVLMAVLCCVTLVWWAEPVTTAETLVRQAQLR
jgi:hypothetical protein